MTGNDAFAVIAITAGLGFLGVIPPPRAAIPTGRARWSRAAWTGSIRFTTVRFSAIPQSPAHMVSCRGQTTFGAWQAIAASTELIATAGTADHR